MNPDQNDPQFFPTDTIVFDTQTGMFYRVFLKAVIDNYTRITLDFETVLRPLPYDFVIVTGPNSVSKMPSIESFWRYLERRQAQNRQDKEGLRHSQRGMHGGSEWIM